MPDDPRLNDLDNTPTRRATFIKQDPVASYTPGNKTDFMKDDPALVDTPVRRTTFQKDDPTLPDTPIRRTTFQKDDPSLPDTPSRRTTFLKDDPDLPETPDRRETFLKQFPAFKHADSHTLDDLQGAARRLSSITGEDEDEYELATPRSGSLRRSLTYTKLNVSRSPQPTAHGSPGSPDYQNEKVLQQSEEIVEPEEVRILSRASSQYFTPLTTPLETPHGSDSEDEEPYQDSVMYLPGHEPFTPDPSHVTIVETSVRHVGLEDVTIETVADLPDDVGLVNQKNPELLTMINGMVAEVHEVGTEVHEVVTEVHQVVTEVHEVVTEVCETYTEIIEEVQEEIHFQDGIFGSQSTPVQKIISREITVKNLGTCTTQETVVESLKFHKESLDNLEDITRLVKEDIVVAYNTVSRHGGEDEVCSEMQESDAAVTTDGISEEQAVAAVCAVLQVVDEMPTKTHEIGEPAVHQREDDPVSFEVSPVADGAIITESAEGVTDDASKESPVVDSSDTSNASAVLSWLERGCGPPGVSGSPDDDARGQLGPNTSAPVGSLDSWLAKGEFNHQDISPKILLDESFSHKQVIDQLQTIKDELQQRLSSTPLAVRRIPFQNDDDSWCSTKLPDGLSSTPSPIIGRRVSNDTVIKEKPSLSLLSRALANPKLCQSIPEPRNVSSSGSSRSLREPDSKKQLFRRPSTVEEEPVMSSIGKTHLMSSTDKTHLMSSTDKTHLMSSTDKTRVLVGDHADVSHEVSTHCQHHDDVHASVKTVIEKQIGDLSLVSHTSHRGVPLLLKRDVSPLSRKRPLSGDRQSALARLAAPTEASRKRAKSERGAGRAAPPTVSKAPSGVASKAPSGVTSKAPSGVTSKAPSGGGEQKLTRTMQLRRQGMVNRSYQEEPFTIYHLEQ